MATVLPMGYIVCAQGMLEKRNYDSWRHRALSCKGLLLSSAPYWKGMIGAICQSYHCVLLKWCNRQYMKEFAKWMYNIYACTESANKEECDIENGISFHLASAIHKDLVDRWFMGIISDGLLSGRQTRFRIIQVGWHAFEMVINTVLLVYFWAVIGLKCNVKYSAIGFYWYTIQYIFSHIKLYIYIFCLCICSFLCYIALWYTKAYQYWTV